jgi:hypothetical protein
LKYEPKVKARHIINSNMTKHLGDIILVTDTSHVTNRVQTSVSVGKRSLVELAAAGRKKGDGFVNAAHTNGTRN